MALEELGFGEGKWKESSKKSTCYKSINFHNQYPDFVMSYTDFPINRGKDIRGEHDEF